MVIGGSPVRGRRDAGLTAGSERAGTPRRPGPSLIGSALLDRVGREVALLEELPVLRRGVELVVRDGVLGGVAVGVEADLAEDRVERVGRVSDVGADRLAELGQVRHAGADGLEGLRGRSACTRSPGRCRRRGRC